MRKRLGANWASTPTRTNISATWIRSCSAQSAWSSIPASIRRVGRATRPSSTSSTTARAGRSNATAETERFIAIPGQALAYKIGQLKISELRAKAERELGPKFDIREFHAQVLMTGALPLQILEQKIDRWIAAKKAS